MPLGFAGEEGDGDRQERRKDISGLWIRHCVRRDTERGESELIEFGRTAIKRGSCPSSSSSSLYVVPRRVR